MCSLDFEELTMKYQSMVRHACGTERGFRGSIRLQGWGNVGAVGHDDGGVRVGQGAFRG